MKIYVFSQTMLNHYLKVMSLAKKVTQKAIAQLQEFGSLHPDSRGVKRFKA